MEGVGACGGDVTAPAAVLADVKESTRLRAGDVLVTRQTDPGWGPVFPLISGLVVERGGMLSHGAIIAREFGIPSVVGVKDATRRILHGDVVTVDGDRARSRSSRTPQRRRSGGPRHERPPSTLSSRAAPMGDDVDRAAAARRLRTGWRAAVIRRPSWWTSCSRPCCSHNSESSTIWRIAPATRAHTQGVFSSARGPCGRLSSPGSFSLRQR